MKIQIRSMAWLAATALVAARAGADQGVPAGAVERPPTYYGAGVAQEAAQRFQGALLAATILLDEGALPSPRTLAELRASFPAIYRPGTPFAAEIGRAIGPLADSLGGREAGPEELTRRHVARALVWLEMAKGVAGMDSATGRLRAAITQDPDKARLSGDLMEQYRRANKDEVCLLPRLELGCSDGMLELGAQLQKEHEEFEDTRCPRDCGGGEG